MREVTKDRALLGVLAVLVLVAFVAGCGLVPDQGQVRQEAKKKVDELKKKVEVAQEDVKKKVDDVQKDVNDLKKKVNELLKKIDAQQQQNQKEKK
jgi:TolA-binding protein